MNKKFNKEELSKLAGISKIIKQSETFFIAGHIKPDGDSLGSALALASALKRLDKKATVYCNDEIPSFLKFLKGTDKIKKVPKSTDLFDCAIILECINFSRMGDIISPDQAKKIINIDHHSMFTNFGDINYIVPESASTAELVLNVFEYMKIKPTKSEAECLYTGILTDTGRFQQLNTTADSHIAAAKLINAGVSPNEISHQVYESNSKASLRLLGLALSDIEADFDGQMAYLKVTKDMFEKTGAREEEMESIVNYTLKIKGVKAGFLFKEIDENTTKVSCRSVKNFNLLDIVKKCGGGGHKNAAGCTINSNIDDSIKKIKKSFQEIINGKQK